VQAERTLEGCRRHRTAGLRPSALRDQYAHAREGRASDDGKTPPELPRKVQARSDVAREPHALEFASVPVA
jgi:hypothetical protein